MPSSSASVALPGPMTATEQLGHGASRDPKTFSNAEGLTKRPDHSRRDVRAHLAGEPNPVAGALEQSSITACAPAVSSKLRRLAD